jgi:anaerobic magnesium-protoporphyrin IX monomethyl ester cyclase
VSLELLVLNPSSRQAVYQALAKELVAIEPPIWASLIAGYCQLQGVGVEILDAEAEGLTHEQTAARIAALKPTLVAVIVYGHQPSASTQNMPAVRLAVTAIKQHAPAQKVLLVGGHVASLPRQTLAEEAADFVCTGEGPVTTLELCRALAAGETNLSKVRGLMFRDGNEVVSSLPAPMVKNLDAEMPGIPWNLLPMKRYRAHNWHCFGGLDRQPYAALYTTLGCPFRCSFCCIQAPFREGEQLAGAREGTNSYRYWSPERVVEWIDLLVREHGVKNIKFADEMFVLNPRHIRKICELLISRKYDLNIWAYARVDTVRDDMIDLLRAAGFRWLALGIEAASEKVRTDVDKSFELDLVFHTIERLRAADISTIGNYIFGLPEEDEQTMKGTLDLALQLNCEFANFYCAMAYPGSRLYEQALQSGWALPETWGGYSQHSIDSLPLRTHHLTAARVLQFRDDAFHKYFSAPSYLEMVEKKFGAATVDHIRDMTKTRLIRKFA